MAASSSREDTNIQRLLAAEKTAQSIVEAARKERAEKLKLAKQEAATEIAKYRADLEKKYDTNVAASSSVSDSTFQELDKQTSEAIQNIANGLPIKKKEAVDMLVNYVINVETSNV